MVNIDKIKVVIIKSKKRVYVDFKNESSISWKLIKCKYLRIDPNLNSNYNIEKRVNGGWTIYYRLGNSCTLKDVWFWDTNKTLFDTLPTPIILYGREVWGFNISRELWRRIDKIKNAL